MRKTAHVEFAGEGKSLSVLQGRYKTMKGLEAGTIRLDDVEMYFVGDLNWDNQQESPWTETCPSCSK
jgi:hypothetical protein